MKDSSKNIKYDEINLVEVYNTIRRRKNLVLKITAVFILFGLVIAFGIKVEYTAYCKLLHESNQNTNINLGAGLSGLAGLAGINVNELNQTGAITPDLYPKVTKSIPFLLQLLNHPVYFQKEDTTLTPFTYFKEIYRPSLFEFFYVYIIRSPYQIKKIFRKSDNNATIDQNDEILRLSREDLLIIERLKERINVSVDPTTGIITLVTVMPDRNAAAEITNEAYKILTAYLTNYKVNKATQNLEYVKGLYNDSKKEFENAQKTLAIFNDRNRNVVTAIAQTEQKSLQNEYNIAFEVYKGLASQLEQVKIAVKEETPVFTILEPVQYPIEKSKPRRTIILIITAILGLGFGSIYVLATNKSFH